MLVFQYFEIASFGLSLILLKKFKGTPFIWFVPYLAFVVIVDVIANYFPMILNGSNQWRFNLYLPFQNLFFSWLFLSYLNQRGHKKIVRYGIILFAVFFLINVIFIQGPWIFNTYAFTVTSVEMIIYSNLYFLETIRKDSNRSIFAQSMFWIGAACLIFFTGFAVFFAVYFYYNESPQAFAEHRILYIFIDKYVNSIHYSLLMIAMSLFTRRNGF